VMGTLATGQWLSLTGGILLFVGLAAAFRSTRLDASILGETRLGYAQWASEEGRKRDLAQRSKRRRADRMFNVGLVATALGIALQTAAAFGR
jgi:hypothetical protein